MPKQYYMQDTRKYVGNFVLWWRSGGRGYTTDIREAEVWSEDDARKQHGCRDTDIPWDRDYIDKRTCLAVDSQNIDSSGEMSLPPTWLSEEGD